MAGTAEQRRPDSSSEALDWTKVKPRGVYDLLRELAPLVQEKSESAWAQIRNRLDGLSDEELSAAAMLAQIELMHVGAVTDSGQREYEGAEGDLLKDFDTISGLSRILDGEDSIRAESHIEVVPFSPSENIRRLQGR